MDGHYNQTSPERFVERPTNRRTVSIELSSVQTPDNASAEAPKRDAWSNDWEFLMSCIAMSVGLGNVWRFPFVALENGGGAFLIPYLVVLFIIGRPIYYLEMLVGQFSSRGSVQVYDMAPAMRGIGYGQMLAMSSMLSYYTSLLALALRYFLSSFQSVLPWSVCQPEWGPQCIASGSKAANVSGSNETQRTTSAELYFYKEILKETSSLEDGIGLPDLRLCLCLGFSWICITLIVSKGIQSSGKASYFLALFPYVTLGILFVRAVTLPSAFNGIMVFLTPQWAQLLNVKVWFAAITQVFYSLSVCIGPIIMYSSFNQFRHNIYRDAMIVTSLDTVTSFMSGVIIFGILGNLAHETGTTDITAVVQGGTGLAFVSYPDAISKFEFWPQAFAVNFFFMLFVLGIGCVIGGQVCVTSLLRDRFKSLNRLGLMIGMGVVQFCVGCLFLTPGGQYLLNLVDYHSVSYVLIWIAIAELLTISWIYGTKRLCRDIEFMLGIKTGWYWRTCWAIVAPVIMIVVLFYQMATIEALQYNGKKYPTQYAVAGWCLSILGLIQIPLWMVYGVYQQRGDTLGEKVKEAFRPLNNWGPMDGELFEQYRKFMLNENMVQPTGLWARFYDHVYG